MTLTADQSALLISGVLWLAALTAWLFSVQARGKVMLRELRERADAGTWESIGAPVSLQGAMADPERRWLRFIRSGDYRRQLDPASVELIDRFRRRVRTMLLLFALSALALLIRFWPELQPDFLQ
jgi:hypothetical protein